MTRQTLAVALIAIAAAAFAIDARAEVGASGATARGTIKVIAPVITGIRVGYDPRAQTSGAVPVSIAVFSSSSELIVQRSTPQSPQPYLRVRNSNTPGGRKLGSGWSSFTEDIRSAPARVSISAEGRAADVVYEIWAF